MLLQMLQLEGLVTAKSAYYDPRFRESWKIERAFNGLVESFPSCLIQAYTLLCMAQLGHLDEVWNTIWQVFSIMLSCHSMAAAVKLGMTLLPRHPGFEFVLLFAPFPPPPPPVFRGAFPKTTAKRCLGVPTAGGEIAKDPPAQTLN